MSLSPESCVSPIDARTGEFKMILFLQTCKESIYYYSSVSYLPSIPDLVSEMFAQNRNWDDMTDLPTSLSYLPSSQGNSLFPT